MGFACLSHFHLPFAFCPDNSTKYCCPRSPFELQVKRHRVKKERISTCVHTILLAMDNWLFNLLWARVQYTHQFTCSFLFHPEILFTRLGNCLFPYVWCYLLA